MKEVYVSLNGKKFDKMRDAMRKQAEEDVGVEAVKKDDILCANLHECSVDIDGYDGVIVLLIDTPLGTIVVDLTSEDFIALAEEMRKYTNQLDKALRGA